MIICIFQKIFTNLSVAVQLLADGKHLIMNDSFLLVRWPTIYDELEIQTALSTCLQKMCPFSQQLFIRSAST